MLGTIALTLGLAFIPADVIEQLGAYGYLGVFLLTLLASATLVLPSPAVGVALLAGKTLNPWAVGVLAGVAASLGEITGYIAGIGGNQLAQRSRFYPRVEHWVQRWGVLTIFILAAVPGPILDLAGLAAGAMRMPFGRFLIACMLGKTIRFIGVAWIGNLFL
jgi:membrane protein YqaA with SNARE-associated domain